MKFKVEFNANGKDYSVERNLTELDRNFDDEQYALILMENEQSNTGGYYEINLLKSAELNGKFNGKVYVAEYANDDDTMPKDFLDAKLTILD